MRIGLDVAPGYIDRFSSRCDEAVWWVETMDGVEVSLMIVAKPQTWLLAAADPGASARPTPRRRR